MGGKRRDKKFWHNIKPKVKAGGPYLLEQGSLETLRAEKARTQALLEYYWKFHSELAYQRTLKQDDLLNALRENCLASYEFRNWQRAVKYKYSLHPLSTVGSLSDPGGRFNVGDLNPNFRQFPALYMTADKDTALQETLGQAGKGTKLSALEKALTHPQSMTIVSVSGKVDRVFDLRNPKSLGSFIEIIKNFTLSAPLLKIADALNEPRPNLIKNTEQLVESLLNPDWRELPALYDVPANSQVFGHLLYLAQIEGVIYPSKFTSKSCLALFPHHFQFSQSYVELDHETPHPKVPKRIDSSNWKQCDLTPSEMID